MLILFVPLTCLPFAPHSLSRRDSQISVTLPSFLPPVVWPAAGKWSALAQPLSVLAFSVEAVLILTVTANRIQNSPECTSEPFSSSVPSLTAQSTSNCHQFPANYHQPEDSKSPGYQLPRKQRRKYPMISPLLTHPQLLVALRNVLLPAACPRWRTLEA